MPCGLDWLSQTVGRTDPTCMETVEQSTRLAACCSSSWNRTSLTCDFLELSTIKITRPILPHPTRRFLHASAWADKGCFKTEKEALGFSADKVQPLSCHVGKCSYKACCVGHTFWRSRTFIIISYPVTFLSAWEGSELAKALPWRSTGRTGMFINAQVVFIGVALPLAKDEFQWAGVLSLKWNIYGLFIKKTQMEDVRVALLILRAVNLCCCRSDDVREQNLLEKPRLYAECTASFERLFNATVVEI